MWKRDDDQEQISTKDLQMRVECSTMKVKNARVFRQHGSSGRCGVRRRNKAGPPWPTFFIPCARPVKRQAMRELPRFPRREQVVWNGGCHVLSRRFSWGFDTHKHEACPGPALPYQACSLTLCAVCVDLASLTVHLMFCALSQRHFRAFRRRKLNHPPVHSRSFSRR